MDYGIDHKIVTSLKEYTEYVLLRDASAYTNLTDEPLFEYANGDTKIPNKVVHGSQYAQIVHHNDISGVTNVSIEESGTPKAEGSDGLIIDRQHARAILDSGYSGSLTFNGAVKDFNTYISSDSDEKIILETKFNILPDLQSANHIDPYGFTLPSIFFKINSSVNQVYCLGGTKKTNWVIRAIIMSDSEYLLVGASGVFRDLDLKCFPVLSASDVPLTEFGALKDANWQYSDFLASPDNKAYIERVLYTPIQSTQFTEHNPKIYIGICDFFVYMRR